MKWLISLILMCCFTSCFDMPECRNTNPIFEKFTPGDKQYKTELMRLISKSHKRSLHYWVDKYREENGRRMLHVFIQGDSICAKIILDVSDTSAYKNGLGGIIEKKAGGYSGAELEGLVYYIDTTGDINFIFRKVNTILD